MPAPTITTLALVLRFRGCSDGVSAVAIHTDVVVPEVGCIWFNNESERHAIRSATVIASRATISQRAVSIHNNNSAEQRNGYDIVSAETAKNKLEFPFDHF